MRPFSYQRATDPEMAVQALSAARKGDVKRAKELWSSLLRDPAAPQGVQQRAQAMLTLHGAAEGK